MYNTLKMIILLTNTDFQLIKNLKTQQDNEDIQRKEYTLSFIPDSLSLSEFNFSIISKNKLNNKDSIENVKKIKFFKKYLPKEKIKIPKGYIISKLQTNIIHLLENNKISFNIFDKDSILNATAYEIKSFKHSDSLISGHFPINNVEINKINTNISVTKGDFFIPTEQKGIK